MTHDLLGCLEAAYRDLENEHDIRIFYFSYRDHWRQIRESLDIHDEDGLHLVVVGRIMRMLEKAPPKKRALWIRALTINGGFCHGHTKCA